MNSAGGLSPYLEGGFPMASPNDYRWFSCTAITRVARARDTGQGQHIAGSCRQSAARLAGGETHYFEMSQVPPNLNRKSIIFKGETLYSMGR